MMTSSQLASRLGVNQSTVSKLELSEINSSIRLSSLEKAAEALGCRLEYTLVPEKPLEELVFERAKLKLSEEEARTAHTLVLEDQKADGNKLNEEIDAAFLIEELGSRIWDD